MVNVFYPLHRLTKFFAPLASPPFCYGWIARLLPLFSILALMALSYGLYAGLYLAPADYQQGDGFRIIYVHVPAAILSLNIYCVMAIAAAIGLIWHIKMAHWVAYCSASIGASFTAVALVTGSLWGKPMWGTWWVWDARLTSELILLFLYAGYLALYQAIDNKKSAAKASGLLAIIGVVNIPIIHYSVYWWQTLHQGATISQFAKPKMAAPMLYPLLSMIAGFFLLYVIILMLRLRCEILKADSKTRWLKQLLEKTV